jgi:2,4-dienoyl-CoA reductase-like NADH-dependent reductase (Old Yellow Enzyme family)
LLPNGALGEILGSLLILPARELTRDEIPSIVQKFATTARLAEQAHWDGVEIHAAHGYLLSQFLSTNANHRTDDYGGTARGRRKLLLEVIAAVRKATSDNFVVGVKLNAKDRQSDGLDRETECLELISELTRLGQVDFIEMSSGTFEDALHVRNATTLDNKVLPAEEGFYCSFAERLRDQLEEQKRKDSTSPPLIVLTGGFRTAKGMESAIQRRIADIIGLGRPVCMDPDIAKDLLEGRQQTEVPPTLSFAFAKALLEPVLNSLWYQRQLDRLSRGLPADPNLSIMWTLTVTFFKSYIWDWKTVWHRSGVQNGESADFEKKKAK